MNTRLDNQTALVTGSTRNIGRATAEALAAAGAHVVVSGRDLVLGEAVVTGIRDRGGRADFVRADLDGTLATSRALAEEATGVVGGRLDILVNNAGVYPPTTTLDATEQLLDHMYAVNVKAPYLLVQALAPQMIAAGRGTIINLGSWAARLGLPVGGFYAATKGAMETLTRAWAAEFGQQGIRVNAVSPGVIRPPETDGEFRGEALMAATPAGRAGTPQAIADAVVYLASDAARFTHGAVLDVDGGRVSVAAVGGL